LADFAAALQLDPDSVEGVPGSRGSLTGTRTDSTKRWPISTVPCSSRRKNPDLRIARASIEELRHVEPDAMTDLMRAIQFRPDQATYSTRAAFYARIGRRDQALAQGAQGIARALKGQFTAGPQVGRWSGAARQGSSQGSQCDPRSSRGRRLPTAPRPSRRAPWGCWSPKQVGRAIATLDPSIANGSEEPLMFVLRGKAFYQNGENWSARIRPGFEA